MTWTLQYDGRMFAIRYNKYSCGINNFTIWWSDVCNTVQQMFPLHQQLYNMMVGCLQYGTTNVPAASTTLQYVGRMFAIRYNKCSCGINFTICWSDVCNTVQQMFLRHPQLYNMMVGCVYYSTIMYLVIQTW